MRGWSAKYAKRRENVSCVLRALIGKADLGSIHPCDFANEFVSHLDCLSPADLRSVTHCSDIGRGVKIVDGLLRSNREGR